VYSKKSLGQNFFNNKSLAEKIVRMVLEGKPNGVLEIGPGQGFFTKIFRESPNVEILCVEKDDQLSSELRDSIPDITVLNRDFLEISEKELRKNVGDHTGRFICFGSLPYNVSKPIIHKCIQMKDLFSNFFFIIQKEVAVKLITPNPKNSYLALKTKIFADAKRVLNIGPSSFTPKPKVESSLVHLVPNDNSKNLDTEKLDDLLKISFSHPRKTLKNNLKHANIDTAKVSEKLLIMRPQELSFDLYVELLSEVQM